MGHVGARRSSPIGRLTGGFANGVNETGVVREVLSEVGEKVPTQYSVTRLGGIKSDKYPWTENKDFTVVVFPPPGTGPVRPPRRVYQSRIDLGDGRHQFVV